jgi:hypothetical protein
MPLGLASQQNVVYPGFDPSFQYTGGKGSGRGKLTRSDGSVFDGHFKDGKFQGQGKWVLASGAVFEGEFKEDKRWGPGKLRFPDGKVEIQEYREYDPVGEGVRWSADGLRAWRMVEGRQREPIPVEEAAAVAERLGLAVPSFGEDED